MARLQALMMEEPRAGDVIPGSGGLRKLRAADSRRGKGRRGGLRIVYYWWESGRQFWLFRIFDKSEAADLSPGQRGVLKALLKAEMQARSEA